MSSKLLEKSSDLLSKENDFKCEHCGKNFSSRQSLFKHKSTATYCLNTREKVLNLKCKACSKKFNRKDNLVNHELKCKHLLFEKIFDKINSLESQVENLTEEVKILNERLSYSEKQIINTTGDNNNIN